MLTIDDSKLNLSKIQEAVLRVSGVDREKHLNQYINTITELDKNAFNEFLEEINSNEEHNQTLEEEFGFLEIIINDYNKLLELQTHFKKMCLEYGNVQLELSDLSLIDFQYIENRYRSIKGYLSNIGNIEESKIELQRLNESLIEEEKKKSSLDNRMREMDNSLKSNFVDAEGRYVIDGKLSYVSVVSEYRQIELDFLSLLDDEKKLKHMLYDAERELSEVSEKLRTAEVCCNSMASFNSHQILDDINNEFLKVKYKVAMLKIVSLLTSNSENYDMFKKKREDILELIKVRANCLQGLGYNISIDPFDRAKVKEQLESVSRLSDNVNNINKLRKNISSLTTRMDEMISQNNEYLITIGETKPLIINNLSFNDIDISPIVTFDELVLKQEVKENQVIGVKIVSSKIDIELVRKKTSSVISRVNGMLNKKEVKTASVIVPELVIGPKEAVLKEEEEINLDLVDSKEEFTDIITDEKEVSSKEEVKGINIIDTNSIDLDIFKTVSPFDEPILFVDKLDEEERPEEVTFDLNSISDLSSLEFSTDNNVESTETVDLSNAMPDAFWVTDSDLKEEETNNALSFDEQINVLLSSENKDVKVKKRAA